MGDGRRKTNFVSHDSGSISSAVCRLPSVGSMKFSVVIAGRPNVGKSALFNRLLRRRRSLIHDLPGMTRDTLEVEALLPDGRTYRLIDTGGYDPAGKEAIPR